LREIVSGCRFSHPRLPSLVVVFVWIGSGALAQQAPAAAPPGAPPAMPSATAVASARALVVATGISRCFALLLPQFMDQIGKNLSQTRPDLGKDLDLVLTALRPEFDRQADEMITVAAEVYAEHIPEADLQASVAFFTSPSGQKYVEAQPTILTEVVTAMQGWQGKISTEMMTRARRDEEEGPRAVRREPATEPA
jgi:hypothetical protein